MTESIVKGRWKLANKIGQGAFGEIYQAVDIVTGEHVAIKLERCDSKKQVLKLEVAVLKKLQGCHRVTRFIHCGRNNDYNYVVMELLGENISELRRRQPQQRFSLATTLKLGSQMLRAIQALHERGFLHRDIKPSNFAMGLKGAKAKIVHIIDFGLARRYKLPNNEIRPPREHAGFRGTARYASINSHQSKDLGRRDDLWSLFYLMVEMLVGALPWRKLKEKDDILKMKIKYTTPDLVHGLPAELLAFLLYLNSLQYETEPNYDYINTLFMDLYTRCGFTEDTLFDWERDSSEATEDNEFPVDMRKDRTGPRPPSDSANQSGRKQNHGRYLTGRKPRSKDQLQNAQISSPINIQVSNGSPTQPQPPQSQPTQSSVQVHSSPTPHPYVSRSLPLNAQRRDGGSSENMTPRSSHLAPDEEYNESTRTPFGTSQVGAVRKSTVNAGDVTSEENLSEGGVTPVPMSPSATPSKIMEWNYNDSPPPKTPIHTVHAKNHVVAPVHVDSKRAQLNDVQVGVHASSSTHSHPQQPRTSHDLKQSHESTTQQQQQQQQQLQQQQQQSEEGCCQKCTLL